jgi:hypothetical protein
MQDIVLAALAGLAVLEVEPASMRLSRASAQTLIEYGAYG